jgi:hypothetical protein
VFPGISTQENNVMFGHTRNALWPVFTLIGITAPLAALADVTVQEQTTVNLATVTGHSLATHHISGDKQRSESELRCDGAMSPVCGQALHVDIVRLDRGVTWIVDPKNKRYTEVPFSMAQQRQEKPQSCPLPLQTPTADTSKCEFTPPKLTVDKSDEVATLAGHGAQRTTLKLVQDCKSQDPSQVCQLTYSFDVWLTLDPVPGGEDQSAFRRLQLTRQGGGEFSAATSAPLARYFAPYAGAMQQLAAKSYELKGYPLKTTFRVSFSGNTCGAADTRTASLAPGTFSDATTAAKAASASSAEHAAGWSATDAVAHSTGSGVGSYVAGSAAGAFTGRLISGFLAKKPKPDPRPPRAAATENAVVKILADVTTETTYLSADTIPAAQFEPPPGWTRLVTNLNGESALSICPKTGF